MTLMAAAVVNTNEITSSNLTNSDQYRTLRTGSDELWRNTDVVMQSVCRYRRPWPDFNFWPCVINCQLINGSDDDTFEFRGCTRECFGNRECVAAFFFCDCFIKRTSGKSRILRDAQCLNRGVGLCCSRKELGADFFVEMWISQTVGHDHFFLIPFAFLSSRISPFYV